MFIQRKGYEMNVDMGDATIDFDLKKEKFAYDVYQKLIEEVGEEKAIDIMRFQKDNITRVKGECTVEEAVKMIKY
ncbi:hypothetical protein MZM54_00320 [[Brevibacterium] frigoritolerans]|nr:hypothetical protein [Peribacillus frigoritolerans]